MDHIYDVDRERSIEEIAACVCTPKTMSALIKAFVERRKSRVLEPDDFMTLLRACRGFHRGAWFDALRQVSEFCDTRLGPAHLAELTQPEWEDEACVCIRELMIHGLLAHDVAVLCFVCKHLSLESFAGAGERSWIRKVWETSGVDGLVQCLKALSTKDAYTMLGIALSMHERIGYTHATHLAPILSVFSDTESRVLAITQIITRVPREIDLDTFSALAVLLGNDVNAHDLIYKFFVPTEVPPDLVTAHNVRHKRKREEEKKVAKNKNQITLPIGVTDQPVDAANEDRNACVVCTLRIVRSLFVPCGHACTCVTCATLIADKDGMCPICNKLVIGVHPVFFS